jgi:hypothetical protein
MTRRARRALILAVAVIAVIIGALVVEVPTGPTADQLRAEIEKTLPIGSSRALVSEFARTHGLEHSSYLERERMINAIRRGVSKGLFSESSIYVRFYFDEKQALERFTVEKVGTSL